jgi:hypothetical protein
MTDKGPRQGIPMRRFYYLVAGVVYTGAVFMAGMLIGQLYAVYVMVYTGAIFMVGLWMGQWWERSWKIRHRESPSMREGALPSSDPEPGTRRRSELTLR